MTNNQTLPTISATDVAKGAASAAAIAGIINYDKLKKGEISPSYVAKNSLKLGVQGAIATSSALSATQYYANKNIFGMLTVLSLGAAGIYAVEKINEKVFNENDEDLKQIEVGE